MGLGWAERTTKSCCSLILGCSSSSRSLQPGWLGLSPLRSRAQSSFRSKSQPKRQQLGASSAGKTQDVQLKPQLPPAWAVSSSAHRRRWQWGQKLPKFSAASQKPVQLWTCSPAKQNIQKTLWETKKGGWNFYFRMKDLEKACTTKRHLPEFPLLWEMGSGFLLWATCPYLPELTRAPNAAPWKATEISLGSLGFYF